MSSQGSALSRISWSELTMIAKAPLMGKHVGDSLLEIESDRESFYFQMCLSI